MDRDELKKIKIEKAKQELIGKTFGLLTVEDFAGTHHKRGFEFKCKCKCGNYVIRSASSIRRIIKNSTNSSCGCEKYGGSPPTHGETKTRLYTIWDGMKERCKDKKNKRYGGRGITICPEWLNDFCTFRDWALSHGYQDDLTIDRIDNNGNYEPDNCRWATKKEQSNNRGVSVKYLYNGEEKNASELGKICGITDVAFRKRLRKGMSVKEAVETPKNFNYDRYAK